MKPGNCGLHTSILGRYAIGSWRSSNPKYVSYFERKKKITYTDEQLEPYLWHEVIEPVIAVEASTNSEGNPWLKLWVLVDGTPRWLGTNAKVMPAGWEPNLR